VVAKAENNDRQNGKEKTIKKPGCEFIELTPPICGRVQPLRTLEENRFEDVNREGKNKAAERILTLTPDSPLCHVMAGDIVMIPWGIRPNTWCPPFSPLGWGPAVYINSPNGVEFLAYDGIKYSNQSETIILSINDDNSWCLIVEDELDHCFDDMNCTNFPEGYSFNQSGGPYAKFEIIRIDEQQNNCGEISHYNVFTEFVDSKGIYLVQ